MLMQAEPVYQAVRSVADKIAGDGAICDDHDIASQVKKHNSRIIYVTPQGRVFNQQMAAEFAGCDNLVFLCGHYEGIDERVLQETVTDYVSIGDYVLTGGELPSMVMIDAISRLVPGVLHNNVSAETESFHGNLLEYPQYTRPAEFRGMKVPEVLLNGNHALIERWRRDRAIELTLSRRPELMEHVELNKKDIAFIQSIKKDEKAR